MGMELSPESLAASQDHTNGDASPNPSEQQSVRIPYRPVGTPMRCPAPSPPAEAVPLGASLGQRVAHLVEVAFINRNFALLWWGQAISSVGDYAWDTALLSVALAGSLVSTVLHGFHASLLGITFGPVDTLFSGMGLLAVLGGIYARVSLRDILAKQPVP